MLRGAVKLVLLLLVAPATAAESILVRMNGTWVSEELTLVLDSDRMLANANRERPFQREPLMLKNVAGSMVVFEVGKRRFIGLFNRDELNLTGDGLAGSTTLRRAQARPRAR